ncbi:MAG: LamG-like jellyroll fold domain-containing protein [Peptococcia bacterium]
MKKRILSVLLVLSMILSLVPFSVYAGTQTGEQSVDGSELEREQWLEYIANKSENTNDQADDNQLFSPSSSNTVVLDGTGISAPAINLSGAASGTSRYTVLVLDQSGSMAGTPITTLKTAALKFCDAVLKAEGDNYVAVVAYDSKASTKCQFSNSYATLETAINNIYARTTTNTNEGLLFADDLLSSIADAPGVIKNVVLLSDGLPNEGSYSYSGNYTYDDYYYYYYANEVYDTATTLKSKGYKLYTLGFFHDLTGATLTFARRFMSDLQNSGYYDVVDPEELEFVFGEIASDIIKKSGIFRYPGSGRDYSAVYYYDDGYFTKSAYNYNPHLATMSFCLELSACGSHDVGGSYENKSLNAQNLLAEIGFSDIETNEWFEVKPTKDSIGAIAAHKTIKDGGKPYELIALAVRGGGYESEWASNFTIGETGKHQGFSEARDQVLEFLDDYISKNAISGDIKLWLTGYSRAGATANLVAGKIDDGYSFNNCYLMRSDLYAYTFETPAGALMSDINNPVYKNIFNIINPNDPVTKVAPAYWSFARYGIDQKLPENVSTNEAIYPNQLAKMLERYDTLVSEYEPKPKYIVDDFKMKKLIPAFDWPPFEFVDNPNDKRTQEQFLTHYINNIIIGEFIKTRTFYVSNYQDGLRDLLSIYFGADAVKTEKLIPIVKEKFKNNWGQIIKPFFINNPFKSASEKEIEALEVIARFLCESLDEADIAYDETTVRIAAVPLADLLAAVASNHPNLAGTMFKNIDGIGSAHFPEICLAWLQSMDSNYTEGGAASFCNGHYRVIRINCPVDVEVYNANGAKVAAIVADTPQDVGYSIVSSINEDGEKIIYLPADSSYSVKTTATGEGTMSFSINEYSPQIGNNTRLVDYYDIPITAGMAFTANIPSFSADELANGIENGSSVAYSLNNDSTGETVPASSDLSGNQATEAYFMVNAYAEDDLCGVVTGKGLRQLGNYAQVSAFAYNGYEFEGWYAGEQKVSSEENYRFRVEADIELVAKFTANTYALTLSAGNGGRITTGASGAYETGTLIPLTATPNSNYRFVNWTSSDGGYFEDANSATTTFAMAGNDVTVTANFELVSPSSSLVGRWSFDEGCGTAAADTSGNNLNGVVSGATWVDGKVGKALKFDGVNDYVEIPYDPILNPKKAITIEAWINPCSTAADQRILSKSPYPNNDYSMIRASNNRVLVSVKMGGTVQSAYSPANSVPVGTWTHVVGTYDGQRMRLYINGTQVNSFAVCGEINAHETPLMIGKNATSAYFKGMVDEICIYDKALTADEILSHYQAAMPTAVTAIEAETTDDGKKVVVAFDKEMADLPAAPAGFCLAVDGVENPIQSVGLNASKDLVELTLANTIYTDSTNIKLSYTAGTIKAEDGGVLASFSDMQVTNKSTVDKVISSLVGRWSFDEGCGTAAADTSGNNLNGVINGATWVDGKVGKALKFDGVNDYVEIPYDPILNPTKAITIEAWINPCSTAADQRILSKSPYPNNDYSMIRASNNRVLVSMKMGETVQSAYSPANAVPVGSWTHVVGTYDGQRMRLYINGTQVNSFAVCGEINAHETPLMIGKNATSAYFKGMVDEVCIYDKALTANEILSHYQAAQDTTE